MMRSQISYKIFIVISESENFLQNIYGTHGDIADADKYSGCSRLNLEYSRVLTRDATLLLFWL